MKYRHHLLVCAAGLCIFAGAAFAQSTDLAAILEQQHALAKDLEAGKSGLNPRQQNIVRKAQQEVFALTEGKSSLDELNIAEKTRLENALERINAQVKGDRRGEETQEVCWRERPTGSRVEITRCGTKEEIQQAKEGARGYLERPRICTPPGCGQ